NSVIGRYCSNRLYKTLPVRLRNHCGAPERVFPTMSSGTVLAATLVQPGQYEVREYPLPEPGPGCVLVKMELSGICGTDKHTYQGYINQYAGIGEGKTIRFPIIQGHENVGTVAAIGGNDHY